MTARAAIGHIPFKGHRTCADWGPEVDRDLFAESLAKHGTIARAAHSVGKDRWWGERQFALLCNGLGEEAA